MVAVTKFLWGRHRSFIMKLQELVTSSAVRPKPFWHLPLGRALVLAILPAIFFCVTRQLTKISGPTWLHSNFENNYPYLFNSLRLIEGHPLYWIDHPGTTTQIFGAAVLRLSELGTGDQIVNAVIANPDKFIKRIQRCLLLFSAISLWFFPWLLALRLQSNIKALLLQVPSLLFATLLHYTIWFSSDLMLIPWCIAGLYLATELVHLTRKGEPQTLQAVFAGIVCALGILTKLTFFPIILILVLACRGWRNRLFMGASTLCSAALVAVPIYPRLPALVTWNVQLATHTGNYGSGDNGFTGPDILLRGATSLISTEPMILWLPVTATIATLLLQFARRRKIDVHSKRFIVITALILFCLQVIGFGLVAKHPGPHYLIPLYLCTGLNLVLLYEAVRSIEWRSFSAKFGTAALAGLLVWAFSSSIASTKNLFRLLGPWGKDQVSMYYRAKKQTDGDLRIDYYRAGSPEFAAFFGNDNAHDESGGDNYFGPLLEKRYPGALFAMDFGPEGLYTFTSEVDPASVISSHDHFYLLGNHSDGRYDKDHMMSIPGIDSKDIKQVDQGGNLYLDEWKRP